ncbi:formin-like protein 4 [Vicia villosa]|uniref:formin-like protein 4 n=1 Tax=Vicia villosa TaxID=3911 RepID=UPI00273BC656|nr:formin-like protein 4 [Vicia villosa]
MSPPIAMAVVATAISMLFLFGIFLYFYHKFFLARYQKVSSKGSFVHEADIKRFGGNVKGVIADENGVDVIYMMDKESRQMITSFPNCMFNPSYEDDVEKEKIIDVLVHRSKISNPHHEIPFSCESQLQKTSPMNLEMNKIHMSYNQPLPSPPSSPPVPPPPPPPAPPKKVIPKGLLPPGPPPLPKASGFSFMKPPPAPKGKANMREGVIGESSREKGGGQTRLKPLHWDKVIADVDHSTVWDQINDGSFRFDDELMESLFGYSTRYQTQERNMSLSNLAKTSSNTPSQIFILEPRKSQNTAIVLRSLAVSRREILDAVLDGQELSVETLEKLTKIAPSPEEASKIVQFSGNPNNLAEAESFLYYILKAVPTSFIRLKAMLFKSNYDSEILQLKEHLQTLDLACKELKTSSLFLKLLEAILKTGNRMNAGTSRGNAQGFNLSALTKLSDVKSTNGKTSLLHFIVEQVAHSEGKRQAIFESEKEYIILGLPVLGELSDELSEAKKAANIHYQTFITMCSTLISHVTEIRHIITCCGNTEKSGFINEMKGFLELCEEELKVVKEEQTRIMELVKKTNEYYLAGASKDNKPNPFHLFVIVKDFVDMVGQTCIELKKKVEKKNVGVEFGSITPPLSPSKMVPLRFSNFDLNFTSNRSDSTFSSQSEDGF